MPKTNTLSCLKIDWDLNLPIKEVMVRRSTRGKGLHIVLYVEGELTDEEILTLQKRLGDDPIRAKLNRIRVEKQVLDWNKLFTRKYPVRP